MALFKFRILEIKCLGFVDQVTRVGCRLGHDMLEPMANQLFVIKPIFHPLINRLNNLRAKEPNRLLINCWTPDSYQVVWIRNEK